MSIVPLAYVDLTEVSDKCPMVSCQKMHEERICHHHMPLRTFCLISPNYAKHYHRSNFMCDKIEKSVKISIQGCLVAQW